jgi:hypothetical protein
MKSIISFSSSVITAEAEHIAKWNDAHEIAYRGKLMNRNQRNG